MLDVQDALLSSNEQVRATLSAAVPGLSEMTIYLTQSMGKGVRTQVLLNAAADKDGKVPEDAPKAAAAIELLHMATLVHDDVLDNAPTRRGMPTLHQKFDTKSAVICGDYLLSQSLLMFANMDAQRFHKTDDNASLVPRFSKALSAVCQGEYMQHKNIGNLDLDLLTYLKIISGKTAALFYIAAYAGAILGGESAEDARALGRFGRCLGLVFQIADDCKDYEWTQEQARKPVASDIRSGVITLPLILAMRKNPDLRYAAQEFMQSQQDTHCFAQAIREVGGTDAARTLAERYVAWGTKTLRGIIPSKQDAMLNILHKAKVGG